MPNLDSKKKFRTKSIYIGEQIRKSEAVISVIDPDEFTLEPVLIWDESDNSDLTFDDSLVLGKGNQGIVHAVLVSFTDDSGNAEDRLCALKSMNKRHFFSCGGRITNHELITAEEASSVDHNIIKLMAMIKDQSNREYALLPFCKLFLDHVKDGIHALNETTSPLLKYDALFHIMTDLLFALKSMHQKGFTHGDLKFENVAYYSGHFCLIDMDCSLKHSEPVHALSGSPMYMHPACFKEIDYCKKPENDIYALGIMLKQLLNDRHVTQWMMQWKKHEAEQVVNELSNEQRKRWQHAKKMSPYQSKPLPLLDVIEQVQSTHGKLEILADRMIDIMIYRERCTDYYAQPTLEEIIAAIQIIQISASQKFNCGETEEQRRTSLENFYDSLVPEHLKRLEEKFCTNQEPQLRMRSNYPSFFVRRPRPDDGNAHCENDAPNTLCVKQPPKI